MKTFDIKIDSFRIYRADEYNIVLSQVREVKKSHLAKGINETREVTIGYYSNIKSAFHKLLNLEVLSQSNTNTVQKLLEAINKAETNIISALEDKRFVA